MPTSLARVVVVLLCAVPASGARTPFSLDDLWEWRTPSDPRIRPDGRWTVYVESWNDRARNASFSNLWAVSTDGKERRRITEGEWRDTLPRWSPDGTHMAWISERAGKWQIRVRPASAGQEVEVTALAAAPLDLAWSPEGDRLAFLAAVAPQNPVSWAPAAVRPRLRPAASSRPHLFVLPAKGGPPKDLGLADEFAWMPDGQSFVVARDGQIDRLAIATGTATRLTSQPGRHQSPVPSQDGSRIAWLATDRGQRTYAVRKLYVMNADGSRVRALSGTLDRDATLPQWSSDSRTVYFTAEDSGQTRVYAAQNDGALRQVTRNAVRLHGFSLADDGTAVAIRGTSTDAGSVVVFAVDRPSAMNALAEPNQHLLAEREIPTPEEIRYDSEGRSIQAWIVKPPGFDESRKYPLVVFAGEDPASMFGADFHFQAHLIAAKGFVVLCPNPRGTPGYGENFGELLRSRLPGDTYDDLRRGAEFMAAKSYIDGERISLVGGLAAAWAAGQVNRFHRIVTIRPSLRRTSEIRGLVWQDPEEYLRHTPVFFARNFKTPALVVAEPVSDPEAHDLFAELQSRHVESALLLREEPASPVSQSLELETIMAWVSQ